MDCSPPGSSVHGILQARILEWVAIPFFRGSSWPRNRTQGSNPGLLHCKQILYCLSCQGKLGLNWVSAKPGTVSLDLFLQGYKDFIQPSHEEINLVCEERWKEKKKWFHSLHSRHCGSLEEFFLLKWSWRWAGHLASLTPFSLCSVSIKYRKSSLSENNWYQKRAT